LKNINSEYNDFLFKIGIKCNSQGYAELIYNKRYNIPFFQTVGEATIRFLKDTSKFINFTGEIFYIICDSIRHPKKVKWKETLYYMDRAGTDAVPIVLLLCFLLGGILAFQGIVQMGKFGLQIYTSNLVGLSIVKELGVLMVAMICIGRAGSAFAAEISTMKVNEEIDAMETMGLETSRFLVLPKMIALVCVMPLLTVIGNIAGIIGGMTVGFLHGGITVSEYYLRTISSLTSTDIIEGLFKSVVYAILISGIACLRGLEAEKDAKGVGHAATSAVVSSLFLIVLADAIITVLLNQ
jgi:phospholipid/cholesterol/gamma-HCH transport system permease protein